MNGVIDIFIHLHKSHSDSYDRQTISGEIKILRALHGEKICSECTKNYNIISELEPQYYIIFIVKVPNSIRCV